MGQIYSLTFEDAQKIMRAAVEGLEAQSAVAAICIFNLFGFEIMKMAMDGIKPVTLHVATMKAKQAAWIGKSTRTTRDQINDGERTPEILGIEPDSVVPFAGGMPVYDKEGHHLGGVGVSNLTEDKDEMIAENAIREAGFEVNS